MANEDIKVYAKQCRVTYWQIADELGVCENTIAHRFRHEFSPEERERIISIIQKLSNTRITEDESLYLWKER